MMNLSIVLVWRYLLVTYSKIRLHYYIDTAHKNHEMYSLTVCTYEYYNILKFTLRGLFVLKRSDFYNFDRADKITSGSPIVERRYIKLYGLILIIFISTLT